jgi:D-erythrulose 4-kinase
MADTGPQYTAQTWPTSAALLQSPGADTLARSVNDAEASVWAGLAAVSACGHMFGSPAAGPVYREAKSAQMGGGVLLSYGNYGADVLHFGQTQQQLNAEGIETRTVVVTDDIASAPIDQREKRCGIDGDTTVFKIAGAGAEAGLTLDDIERLAIKVNSRTRSLGVAFDGCTLPGAAEPLFTVPRAQMSLGLGIPGEPGTSEHEMPAASELAELLVSRLLADKPEDAGTRVVPIVDGLGTVKYEELFLLFGKIEQLLIAAGVEIVESECGELVTSPDMSGLSLTLLWLDDELAAYWSALAHTPAYRKGNLTRRGHRDTKQLAEAVAETEQGTAAAIRVGQFAVAAMEMVRAVVVEHEDSLGKLDAIAGDGDHGIGMRRGADAAAAAGGAAAGTDVRNITRASEACSERAGGTSGAPWGAALIAIGHALGKKDSYDGADAGAAVTAFVRQSPNWAKPSLRIRPWWMRCFRSRRSSLRSSAAAHPWTLGSLWPRRQPGSPWSAQSSSARRRAVPDRWQRKASATRTPVPFPLG